MVTRGIMLRALDLGYWLQNLVDACVLECEVVIIRFSYEKCLSHTAATIHGYKLGLVFFKQSAEQCYFFLSAYNHLEFN